VRFGRLRLKAPFNGKTDDGPTITRSTTTSTTQLQGRRAAPSSSNEAVYTIVTACRSSGRTPALSIKSKTENVERVVTEERSAGSADPPPRHVQDIR